MRKEKEKNLKWIPGEPGNPGYWVTDITLNYRRVRRYAGRTLSEARAFLAKLRFAAKDGKLNEVLNPRKSQNTFSEYAKSLLESAEWKQKGRWKRDMTSFRALNAYFKDISLAEINPGKVRAYMTKRIEDGLSPAGVNREISLLKSILYRAEFDGIIPVNPIRGQRIKKLEENNNREQVILSMNLSDEVLKKMIEVAPDYFKPILTLAIATGMRKNEILKLKWQDVDLRLGTIRVRAELAKSKKERIIPISGELVAMLDSLPRKDEYVFYGPGGGPIKDIRGVFRSVLKAVGLKSGQRNGLTFHDLRHVAAFRLVKLADIETVKRILGHSTLLVTSRYLHPTDLDKRLAIERSVESLFSGRQKDVNRKIRASGQEIGLIDKFNNSN